MNKTFKIITLSVLACFIISISASCVPGDTASLLESILKNTDAGEMKFVTSEGETIIVNITKTGPASAGNETTANTRNKTAPAMTVKTTTATTKPATTGVVKHTTTANLADYLPVLNSIEDVFKTLGVWDKAYELQKQGYTWSKIAAELGYNKDSMYARILELNEDKLYKAKESGLIDQAMLDYKIKYYSDLARKWVEKIFVS